LRIVELLAKGKMSVSVLAGRLGVPQAACSQHLNLMRAHGLLTAERRGKTVYYRVANRSALNIIDCIRTHEMRESH
jgi:DNA-binding transcriptional ArsR family regulator